VKVKACLSLIALAGVATLFLVPEQSLTAEGGLPSAVHGDTVAVRDPTPDYPRTGFGRIALNGKKITVIVPAVESQDISNQATYVHETESVLSYFQSAYCGDCNDDGRITIGDATYLVAYVYRSGPAPVGEGDVNLDGSLTVADAVYLVNYIYRGGQPPCSPGWAGQAKVTSENSIYGICARTSMDSLGNPWVVWVGYTLEHPDYHLIWYTKWNGLGWEQQELVVTDETGDNFMTWLTFDSEGRAWVSWHRYINSRKRDALFTSWEGDGWIAEQLIHPPDPDTITNACPRTGAGGGEVWATWVHGLSSTRYVDVYASHWSGSSWDPPMMVNDSNSVGDGHFLQVVVDDDGYPHFCWTRYDTNGIFPYYRMYDGVSFTPEKRMNDPDGGIQGEYLSMAIDSLGNYHFAWMAIVESPPIDAYIFYRTYDGENWSTARCVSTLDGLGNWRPMIAANSPDNVWIAWDGTDGSGDYHIYAVHYDGVAWSGETRLDGDETSDDGDTNISLDRAGKPWVVWDGTAYSTRQAYYNRLQ